MSSSRRFSAIFLIVVVLVLAGLMYLGYFVSDVLRPASDDSSTIEFIIESGEGVNNIGDSLFAAGLIRSQRTFRVYVWLRDVEGQLQAGKYDLPRNLNVRELAQILVTGQEAVEERNITIIEGWTLRDVANYLEAEDVVDSEDFLETAGRLAAHDIIPVLGDKPASATLEGYLFPDTYRIYKGATAEEIIIKILSNFESKFTKEFRADVKKNGHTVFEIVTLASILEKEIVNPADLPIAAGVFYKRLEVGKALESDATLNYVLRKEDRKSRLTYDNLDNPSLYNSYKYKGLPPGPISNPGLAAIKAAIYPESNDYWFFLTTQNGETKFAKTFKEHLANKRLYLK